MHREECRRTVVPRSRVVPDVAQEGRPDHPGPDAEAGKEPGGPAREHHDVQYGNGIWPDPPILPPAVTALVGDEPVRPVWRNELDGVTFAVGTDRFLKFSPSAAGIDLGGEAQRMRWAARFATVPAVLAVGGDDTGSWLVTGALPGRSAVLWEDDPETAVRAIG